MLENALFQWAEGERRVREAAGLERAVEVVLEELRRRLGGTFTVNELADFYGEGTDWALETAQARAPGGEASHVVDAAFNRYAREARNYAGGRARERHERPDS
jgi:hypothetical protein